MYIHLIKNINQWLKKSILVGRPLMYIHLIIKNKSMTEEIDIEVRVYLVYALMVKWNRLKMSVLKVSVYVYTLNSKI
jgi:hypothetical protein